MATTSFDKDFTLHTKKSADSFIKFLTTPIPSIKIQKELASQSNGVGSEETLKNSIQLHKR